MHSRRTLSQHEEERTQHLKTWLFFLLLGFAIIVAGNLWGRFLWEEDLWGQRAWLVATLVSVCMVIYAGVTKDINIPNDVKGDSIYYLGLLFTFAALVAALIAFSVGADGNAVSASGSIRNFGIALLTTIVGLAGRVWFTMSKESPGDVEDAVRFQLDEAVSRMKQSLDRARTELEIMANQFQTSSEGLRDVAESIGAGTRQAAATIIGLQDQTGQITDVAEALTRELGEMRTVCFSNVQILSRLESQAGGLGRRFDEIVVKFGPLNEAIEELGPAVGTLDSSLKQIKSTGEAVNALGDNFSSVIAPVRSKVQDFNSDLAAAGNQTADFSRVLAETAEQAEGFFQVLAEGEKERRDQAQRFFNALAEGERRWRESRVTFQIRRTAKAMWTSTRRFLWPRRNS